MPESQLAVRQNTINSQPTLKPEGFLRPTNVNEALQIAEWLSKSSMVPDEYKGKPENILVAMEMGSEVGLGIMQSLQNISVIGSRPSIWGDAMLALVLGSGLCEDIQESFDDDTKTALCVVKRLGMAKPHAATYSFDDAKQAGLIGGKSYVWKSNPRRMAQMRARSFCLRDVFPDVLKGLAKLPLTDERNVRDITPEPKKPEPVSFDKETGEILEEDSEEHFVSLPEPDDATRLAMDAIHQDLKQAVTKKQMLALKRQIEQIPVDFQPELVDAWNEKLSALKTVSARKPKPPQEDLTEEAELLDDG